MKFRLLLIWLLLILFLNAGCQESAKLPEPGMVTVTIEGGGEFPAELAGNWKGSREGWGFVFEKDGSISKARIDTGRRIVIPGEVNIGETKYGGRKDIFKGAVVFDGMKDQGDCQVRLYFRDSYDVEAVYNFGVGKPNETPNQPAKSGAPFIKTDKTTYAVGEKIKVQFKNALGVPRDWVGIYKEKGEGKEQKAIDWLYTDGRKRGESRYTPGDWSIIYFPQSRELAVEIEMKDIYVETAGAIVHGKTTNYFVGPISQDGTKWEATQFSYIDFEGFPTLPEQEYQIVFTKVDEDI